LKKRKIERDYIYPERGGEKKEREVYVFLSQDERKPDCTTSTLTEKGGGGEFGLLDGEKRGEDLGISTLPSTFSSSAGEETSIL